MNITSIKDDYGNTVCLPVGFKISSDSSTAVAGGVVIEDASAGDSTSKGSQFVWIPVGKGIKKNATETVDITLGRYTFDNIGNPTLEQNATNYTTDVAIGNFHELETSTYGNATAKSLTNFVNSVNREGGYYLARYEAGVVGYNSTVSTSNSSNLTSWTGYTNGHIVSQRENKYGIT